MSKITIAVDLDSTLNNLDEVWIIQDYNRLYNDNLKREDMVRWSTHTYVKPECGRKVYDILAEPGYFRNLNLKDEWTKEGFDWLIENFDVYIVSSCHPDSVGDKIAWVKEYFPQFDTSKFIACSHKGLINTDYLIDDGPHNVVDFKQRSVLVEAPYNQYLDAIDHNFVRKGNWKEIKNFFGRVLEYEAEIMA